MINLNASDKPSVAFQSTPWPQWVSFSSTIPDLTLEHYVDSYVAAQTQKSVSQWYPSTSALPYFCNSYVEPMEMEDGSVIDVCYEGFAKAQKLGIAGDLDEEIKNNAIAKVVPATVQIRVVGNNKQSWAGSGFILDPADAAALLPGMEVPAGTYFISTNHHVANEAKTITIYTADGKRTFTAEVVKNQDGRPLMDAVADTALLMIKSDEELPTARIGDPGAVVQGDTVLTAGYPLALPKISVTKGIISQPKQMTGEVLLALQADAAINPGNSGGPLFTLEGLVIGTNTYTFRGANDMSFAQPITEQFAVLSKIWEEGEYVRGDIGVDLMELDTFLRETEGLPPDVNGAVVSQVTPGSTADELGLKMGDIISTIEVFNEYGDVIKTVDIDMLYDFQRTQAMGQIHSLLPGQEIRVKVYRRESNYPLTYKEDTVVMLVSKYEEPASLASESWGLGIERGSDGQLLIGTVKDDSPAMAAGIEGEGRWVLRGIRARELNDFDPQMVRSLTDCSNILETLRTRGTTEMLLYLEDSANPRHRKIVKLSRGLTGEFMAQGEAMMLGAQRMVA